MEQLFAMGKRNCVSDLFKNLDVFAPGLGSNRLEPRFATNLFHRIKRTYNAACVCRDTDVVNRNNVGVLKFPRKLCFTKKLVL